MRHIDAVCRRKLSCKWGDYWGNDTNISVDAFPYLDWSQTGLLAKIAQLAYGTCVANGDIIKVYYPETDQMFDVVVRWR